MSDRLSVLVAEDESLIRIDLVEMLTELGYDVVAAVGDGAEAIEQATRLQPHLALLDIKMPLLDGLSAAEQISALGTTAVVMLTAFSQPELAERATAAGAMAYLVKPVSKADLGPAMVLARARFAERAEMSGQIGNLQGQLEARKVIDRAKGVLQSLGMTEPEAFRKLQRAAMDERRAMSDIARDVLAKFDASEKADPTQSETDES